MNIHLAFYPYQKVHNQGILFRQGENNFMVGNFKSAIKIKLALDGKITYGKHIQHALKWIEKYNIDLGEAMEYYGLTENITRLRCKLI